MSDFVGWVTTILGVELATVGGVNVTVGLVAAGWLIFEVGIRVFHNLTDDEFAGEWDDMAPEYRADWFHRRGEE